jgi:ABC-type antimicrobial peptide transport system permease subunit
LETIEALPGVTEAGLTSLLTLRGELGTPLWPADGPAVDSMVQTAEHRVVSDAYFRVMGIELLQGRPFRADDGYGGPPVAIVSRALADRLFPGRDPLGQALHLGRKDEKGWTVIGVVADVPTKGGTRIAPETVYRSFRQGVGNEVTFVLKTHGPPETLAEAAVAALQSADPDLPAFAVASMDEVVAEAYRQHRMLLILFGFFGLSTLGLSGLGIFGVVSFAVTRRTREIGIRVAMGSGSQRVMGLLLSEGLKLGFWGVVVGLLGAVGLSRFLRPSLYEVGSLDPWVFGASAGFLLLLVTISSLVPALGAMRVDPVSAIKAR